jgi:hypothetical protein
MELDMRTIPFSSEKGKMLFSEIQLPLSGAL